MFGFFIFIKKNTAESQKKVPALPAGRRKGAKNSNERFCAFAFSLRFSGINMNKQEFTKLANELKPVLKRISAKRRFLGFIDADDLYQEALINLWKRSENGEFQDKTVSYIVRSCYFHIQNYIRTHKVRTDMLSLEESNVYNAEGSFCLKDIVVDEGGFFFDRLNSRLIVDEIMNNGLKKKEKDVLRFLYQGLSLRETARRLGMSHVGVLKIKKKISLKYAAKYYR